VGPGGRRGGWLVRADGWAGCGRSRRRAPISPIPGMSF